MTRVASLYVYMLAHIGAGAYTRQNAVVLSQDHSILSGISPSTNIC